ncbi:MAG: hypothetical protein VR73_05155 [Gammaproteobacteria bacterium BRH_c0]|nr:MAG: hypothetical protein VR73_05155 [Gammaproteobacteria bacterium BRH_c0]
MLRNTGESWGSVSKTFHWLMALLIIVQCVLGWLAVTYPLSPAKLELFLWHKSLGILLLGLVVLRLVWRIATPVPTPLFGGQRWEPAAASATHWLLYLLMIALPLSGWVINSAANMPFSVFRLFPLPHIVTPDRELRALAETLHLALFWLLAGLLILHIGAALRHHFVRCNAVLTRMLPMGRKKL